MVALRSSNLINTYGVSVEISVTFGYGLLALTWIALASTTLAAVFYGLT